MIMSSGFDPVVVLKGYPTCGRSMQHMALGYAQPAEHCCWAGRQAWSSVLAALPQASLAPST